MARDDPTIYECAGGPAAFERWLGRFYDLVEDDELLAPVFGGTVGEQPRRDVVTWWCEVMGGPADHTAGLGVRARAGHAPRPADHRRASAALRDLLALAADQVHLPDDPEFRAAITGYAEWGTRLAVHDSGDVTDIAEHAPVPRWGWEWRRPTAPEPCGRRRPAQRRCAGAGPGLTLWALVARVPVTS